MKEEISGFLDDISELDNIKKAKRLEEFIIMQIENFILWNWSNGDEQKRELKALEEWIIQDDS